MGFLFPSILSELCSGQAFYLQKERREITPYILVIRIWFLHSAITLMAVYQCIKFILFISAFSEICFRQAYYCKTKDGYNSVIACDRDTFLAFCTFSTRSLLMYQVSFHSLLYFQRYAPDKLLFQNIKRKITP